MLINVSLIDLHGRREVTLQCSCCVCLAALPGSCSCHSYNTTILSGLLDLSMCPHFTFTKNKHGTVHLGLSELTEITRGRDGEEPLKIISTQHISSSSCCLREFVLSTITGLHVTHINLGIYKCIHIYCTVKSFRQA